MLGVKITTCPPDIIMPRVTGIDLLTAIRETSQTLQVSSGPASRPSTRGEGVQTGAADYLTKPIRKENLIKAVNNAMKVKKLIDGKALLEEENLYYQKQLEALVEMRDKLAPAGHAGEHLPAERPSSRRATPIRPANQRRVGNLSAAIAKEMNLSREQVDLVRTIGSIHDIGKISIPARSTRSPAADAAGIRNDQNTRGQGLRG
jgi:response regulator RpfG family c-di-GMP phosphodiesterase